MRSQRIIISRPIITRFRGRCSQLDTQPLIIQYIVFWRAGVSAHKVGPSHATRKGWRLRHPHNQTLFFQLFIKEWKKVSHWIQAGATGLDLTQYWRDIARVARAYMLEREREREGHAARACEGERKLCVMRARMESCQNPLRSHWCGDSYPLWEKVAGWNSYRF